MVRETVAMRRATETAAGETGASQDREPHQRAKCPITRCWPIGGAASSAGNPLRQ
jgi:hypothetical protein